MAPDSITYEKDFYENFPSIQFLSIDDFIYTRYQPLWVLLNSLCKSLGDGWILFQFFVAFLINIPIFIFFAKKSKFCFSAILFYLLFEFLYFNMDILREAIAVSFLLLAFSCYSEKKTKGCYVNIAIAFLFHIYAILIAIVVFTCLSKHISDKLKITFSLILFFILINIDNSTLYIANLLSSDSLQLYGSAEIAKMNLTGYIYFFLRIFPVCMVLYVYRKKERFSYLNLDIRTLYVLSLLYIYFVLIRVFSMPFFDRFSNYFVLIIHLVLLNAIYDVLKQIRPKVFHFTLFLMITIGSFIFYFLPMTFPGEFAPMYKRYYPYYSIFNKKEDPDREYIIFKENRNY